MKNTQIYSLFSSSSGNCHYINVGSDKILIDAGKNAKAVTEALYTIGSNIESISAIYLTHEHTDHTSALRVLLKKNPKMRIYAHEKCIDSLLKNDICVSSLNAICEGESIKEGGLRIHSFSVPHDSIACVGYRIEYFDKDNIAHNIGVATDIGHLTCEVTDGLFGCESIIVESNHDTEMLKRGPYPLYLKQRILSSRGHLSNESCAKLCAYLSKNGTKNIILAHLSSENNDPSIALRCTKEATEEYGARVFAASKMHPTCLTN